MRHHRLARSGAASDTGFCGQTPAPERRVSCCRQRLSERAARTGRNPQTGAEIQIAAATIPSFKAGKGLKDQVNP